MDSWIQQLKEHHKTSDPKKAVIDAAKASLWLRANLHELVGENEALKRELKRHEVRFQLLNELHAYSEKLRNGELDWQDGLSIRNRMVEFDAFTPEGNTEEKVVY